MRFLKFVFASGLFIILAVASASQGKASDSDYMAAALSAAPVAVAKNAAVVRIEKDGSMTTLRAGTNGFTCLVMGSDKMCLDANSMDFVGALMKHVAPPDKVGVAYMLAGDDGASNTDPYANGKTETNHWIVTGPHIMLFGPPAKALGYTEAKDPDPTKPYMMWAGTPYEHAMIPVGPPK
jgi:hypothetical protein